MQTQFWIPRNTEKYSFINQIDGNQWNAIRNDQTNVVIQIFSKLEYRNQDSFYKLTAYTESLKNTSEPHISKCIDFYEDSRFLYSVMEKPNGIPLRRFIEMHSAKISENEIKEFIIQLLTILQRFENIPLSITYNNVYIKEDKFELTKITPYMIPEEIDSSYIFESPEVILGKPQTSVSNIWTCGIFLYYILNGNLPYTYTNFDKSEFIESVLNEKIEFPKNLPNEITDLLNKMLVKNTYTRIKVDQILRHQWISKCFKNTQRKSFDDIYQIGCFSPLQVKSNNLITKDNEQICKKQIQIASKKRFSNSTIETKKKIGFY